MVGTTRICKKCNAEKPIIEFRRRPGGYRGTCLNCYRVEHRLYYANHKKRFQERARIRRSMEKVNGIVHKYDSRQRNITNQTRINKMKIDNPMLLRCHKIKWSMNSGAIKLNVPFDRKTLTVSYIYRRIKDNPNCEICGRPFNLTSIEYKDDNAPSADQVIPKKGYIQGNVGIVCWRCNSRKGDMTINLLDKMIEYVRRYEDLCRKNADVRSAES